jgi:hypothetical protein
LYETWVARWRIVANECYDAGGLEIWSGALDAVQLADTINLDTVNSSLATVDLTRFTR